MLFAGVLPEILELLGQRSKWMGSYTSVKGKRWFQVIHLNNTFTNFYLDEMFSYSFLYLGTL